MSKVTQPAGGISDVIGRIERLERGAAREASRQRLSVAPVFADNGKTAAADGDFDVPPADGAIAVVVDTADNTVRLAVRAAGAWKMSVPLS